MTDNTKVIIQGRSPMPAYQEILGVKPVKEKQPAKNFDLHGTSAFPQPFTRLNCGQM